MALPSKSIESLVAMPRSEYGRYFEKHARWIPDAPMVGPCFAIRLGSETLYAHDTYALRLKFSHHMGQLKRKAKRELAVCQ